MVEETKSPAVAPGRPDCQAVGTQGEDQQVEGNNSSEKVKCVEIKRRPQAEDQTTDESYRRKFEPKTLRQDGPPRGLD